MHYYYYFSHYNSEGSRKRAQSLGEVEGENGKRHFLVGGWCGELTGNIWLGYGLV